MCDTLGSAEEWAERIHAEACAEACAGLDPAAIPALVEAVADLCDEGDGTSLDFHAREAARPGTIIRLRAALAKVKGVAR